MSSREPGSTEADLQTSLLQQSCSNHNTTTSSRGPGAWRENGANDAVVVSVEEQQRPLWDHMGRTHWLLTTAIMLSDMFGLGTLSLPSDFARLGWAPALACLGWFAVMSAYAGSLYQRLSLRVPGAVVFDEIGKAALGAPGSAMVYATIYMTIFLNPIILHLTCIETLLQVGSRDVSTYR